MSIILVLHHLLVFLLLRPLASSAALTVSGAGFEASLSVTVRDRLLPGLNRSVSLFTATSVRVTVTCRLTRAVCHCRRDGRYSACSHLAPASIHTHKKACVPAQPRVTRGRYTHSTPLCGQGGFLRRRGVTVTALRVINAEWITALPRAMRFFSMPATHCGRTGVRPAI